MLRLAVGPALVLAAVIAWLSPIEIQADLNVRGKLLSAREWSVERSGQGTLTALLTDVTEGVGREYLMQTVDRGDVASFRLQPHLHVGARVAAGDTIGVLRSTESDLRLAELMGAARVALSEQAVAGAGQKEALLREARSRLKQLTELAALQRRVFERMNRMREGAFVSEQDLEFVEAELVRLDGEVGVAEAQVEVLETGERPEERRLAEARLEAALSQVEALEQQRSGLSVQTPIAGVVARSFSDSVLVVVRDTTQWTVVAPVELQKRRMIHVGQAVSVSGPGVGKMSGTVSQIDDAVAMVAGLPMALTVSRLGPMDSSPPHGLAVTVSFDRGAVRLRDYIVEQLGELFQWRSWLNNAA